MFMETGKMNFNIKKNPRVWIELIFDIVYLLTIFLSATYLYITANPGTIRFRFAMIAFILGGGDSFHLIPRILSLLNKGHKDYRVSLGIGKLITSITMTIFYVLLWGIGRDYYKLSPNILLSISVYSLSLLRLVVCLLPQNQWTSRKPSPRWGIIRNIPFLILGFMVMGLFFLGASLDGGLAYMWLAIAISFLCYMPVVVWVHKRPIVGMLMLPKSCAYVAMILMGFSVV